VPTRRDKETTRELLLEAGFEMMLEQGLEVGWGVRLAEVTERIGLTTGAAYQIWNGSRTRDGMGGQDHFHHDLAVYAMDRLISYTSAGHVAHVQSIADQGASLDRVIREFAAHDFETLTAAPAEGALYLALCAAAVTDRELAERARDSYEQLTELYVGVYEKVLDSFGLEMRPPNTLQNLVASVIALLDGLSMRALVDPDAVPEDHEPPTGAAADANGPWNLFAIGARALLQSMTQPRSAG
jgi:hypothetical protein